jgi:hypothetical protein
VDPLEKSVGLFFAGVPASFAISAGQSASIQGVDQGASDNFRYNFALVEASGHPVTVHVTVFSNTGTALGSKDYTLKAFEQRQPNVTDVVPGFSAINARITATVTGGTGSVLLAGAQLANASQDSSGFEMSFRDGLLASAGGGGGLTLPFSGTFDSLGEAFSITNPNANGTAIAGHASAGEGVFGGTAQGDGVFGSSTDTGTGVSGFSSKGVGVSGESDGQEGVLGLIFNSVYAAVRGTNLNATGSYAPGVLGQSSSNSGIGVWGIAHAKSRPTVSPRPIRRRDQRSGLRERLRRATAYLAFLGTVHGEHQRRPRVQIRQSRRVFDGPPPRADVAEIIASTERLFAGDVVEVISRFRKFRRSLTPERRRRGRDLD